MKALLMLAKQKGASPDAKPLGKPAKAEESEDESSEVEFARLASEATAAGDHDAAAEALVSAIKACMGSYGPKEP